MSLAQRHDNSRSSGSEDDHSDTELQSDSVKQAATSRLSIPQFHCIVSEFSEFKQWLLEEIGFVAVLKIPLLSKINLKFSTWLMSKVSVFNRAIIISDSRILKFSSDDVHKVFGIPPGAQPISGAPPTTMSQDTINQIRACIGLTDKDAHSMKVVENFLKKDISADSTTFEKHCFHIAFVIFVMGHILAPTSKHDYASVDYWGSLGSSHTIANYNWCEYVMKYLLDGVEKVKDDLTNNNPVTHMIGCHLFLQIFYLDNLDLGPLNRRHSLMPQIANFNAESIRKMINMCAAKGDSSFDRANLRSPRTVCYTRYIHDCLPDSSEERTYRKRGIWHPNRTHNKNVPKLRSTKSWIETNQSPTCLFPGPSDFSAYLSTKHPLLNNNPLSWMLKEHNAICFRNQNSLRNLQHQEDIRFAEKLISSLADRCICCSMRGHDNCILRTSEQQNDDSFRTPIGRTRPLFSGDASSSSTNRTACNVRYSMDHEYADDCAQSSSCALKAPRSARMEANIEHDSMPSFDLGFDDLVPLLPQKSRLYTQRGEGIVAEDSLEAITAMNQCWAENIVGNIMLLHEDQPDNCSIVLFGQQIDSTPAKKSIKSPFIATAVDSFTSTLPFAAKIINFTALQQWVCSAPHNLLQRNWIVHHFPRLLTISGTTLRNQLLESHPIDHETCAALMRLFNHLDMQGSSTARTVRWRHYFETNFDSHVVAGTTTSSLLSIQNQICNLPYNLGACKLLIIPAILQHGWVCYMFDMQSKCIHVADPQYNCSSSPRGMKYLLHSTADKIQSSLFQCIRQFYNDFPFGDELWQKNYLALSADEFSSHESGAAMIHYARFFNGEKLHPRLDKDTLLSTKTSLFYELLQLKGNVSEIADGTLEAISKLQ